MSSPFELIFFGIFCFVFYRYILPSIAEYVRSYGAVKKEELVFLHRREEDAKLKLSSALKLYEEKLAELESVAETFDDTLVEITQDLKAKNEIVLKEYEENEKRKILKDLKEEESKVVISCMHLLEAQLQSDLKARNVTCFGIAIDKIREIVKK